MLVRQRRRTFGHDDDVRGGGDHEDNVDVMTPHLFSCGAHDTADTPVKKAKSARHCFSCSKRKFYMFVLDMVGGDY